MDREDPPERDDDALEPASNGRAWRRARAELMLTRKLCSMKVSDIAREFHTTRAEVTRELAYAQRAGLLREAHHYMFTRLLPKALAALEVALEAGNYEAARDLFYGLGLWQKSMDVKTVHSLGDGVEGFEAWRMRIVKTKLQPDPQENLDAPALEVALIPDDTSQHSTTGPSLHDSHPPPTLGLGGGGSRASRGRGPRPPVEGLVVEDAADRPRPVVDPGLSDLLEG